MAANLRDSHKLWLLQQSSIMGALQVLQSGLHAVHKLRGEAEFLALTTA